jgi:hypothetical protein
VEGYAFASGIEEFTLKTARDFLCATAIGVAVGFTSISVLITNTCSSKNGSGEQDVAYNDTVASHNHVA